MAYGGNGPMINAVLWTETAIAATFVLARCYTRRFILHSLGLDDYFLIISLLLLVTFSSCVAVGTSYGVGQRRADIAPEDYIEAMKWEVIAQGVSIFNLVASKGAVAFLLLRIVTQAWHKVYIWFCFVTNSIIATWCTIAVFIHCTPVDKIWNPNVEGHCWLDLAKVALATSAYAVCIDFALGTVPCFIIWELNMKRKDKIVTICGLSLGVLAGICGILRTTAIQSLRSHEEYIYDTTNMLIYSGTENFVSALCASVPVIRALWTKVLYGYASSNGSYQKRSHHLSDLNMGDAECAIRESAASPGIETRIYATSFDESIENQSEETILRDKIQRSVIGEQELVCTSKMSINFSQQRRKDSDVYRSDPETYRKNSEAYTSYRKDSNDSR
uniref:Rhodopsin domain-containing protein n=1 Tax=Bionectria ochroleuca TaxID=29856 RepID=A0A8H7NEJ2_BIOOC